MGRCSGSLDIGAGTKTGYELAGQKISKGSPMDFSSNCAWCEHPKAAGPTCSNCGADYAKAEAIKRRGKADIAPVTAAGASAADKGFTSVVIDDSAVGCRPKSREKNLYSCNAVHAGLRFSGADQRLRY